MLSTMSSSRVIRAAVMLNSSPLVLNLDYVRQRIFIVQASVLTNFYIHANWWVLEALGPFYDR